MYSIQQNHFWKSQRTTNGMKCTIKVTSLCWYRSFIKSIHSILQKFHYVNWFKYAYLQVKLVRVCCLKNWKKKIAKKRNRKNTKMTTATATTKLQTTNKKADELKNIGNKAKTFECWLKGTKEFVCLLWLIFFWPSYRLLQVFHTKREWVRILWK